MIGKFSQGSKKAVEKLNRVVSEANKAFDVKTTQGTTSPYTAGDKLYHGKVDVASEDGTFTGTMLDSTGAKVSSSSPFYQLEIHGDGYEVDDDFIAMKSKANQEWYALNKGGGGGSTISIYEIVSNATGDGIYNCYKMIIDATWWGNTSGTDILTVTDVTTYPVFNLAENDEHSHVLSVGDMLLGFTVVDDEGNPRIVGWSPRYAYWHG